MKKTLTLLALALTCSMANVDTSALTTGLTSMDTVEKSEVITREIRSFRNIREHREIRQPRNIEIKKIREVPSFRLARLNREMRDNRFIVQTIRESRKVRYVRSQEEFHLASLK